MLEKIKDIQRAIENRAYLAALVLALTLPDICGKIAYPGMRTSERYTKWFDEYVIKERFPEGYPDELKFDGRKLYKLRCALLHEGSVQGVPDVDSFELRIIESDPPGMYGASSYSVTKCNDGSCHFRVTLDIVVICLDICTKAENFYKSHKDKSIFDDQNIVVIKVPVKNSGLLK